MFGHGTAEAKDRTKRRVVRSLLVAASDISRKVTASGFEKSITGATARSSCHSEPAVITSLTTLMTATYVIEVYLATIFSVDEVPSSGTLAGRKQSNPTSFTRRLFDALRFE